MNLSKFKFHAFTNKGMEKILQKEISKIVKQPKLSFIFGKFGVEFRASFPEILDIMKTSQMIQSLKVQIGHPFLANNEKMFKNKLNNLNFKAWIDLQSTQQKPDVISNSQKSELYHEKMISDIVQNHLEKVYFKPQLKSSLTEDELRLLASMHFDRIKQNKQETEKNETEQKQLVQVQTSDKKRIYVAIYKNNVCVSLELFNEKNFKSGYKPFVGKGSVKESTIYGFLEKSGLLKQFIKDKKVKIIDPFCGSGTILIQSIISALNLKIRQADIQNSNFQKLPLLQNYPEINDLINNFENKENEGIQVQLIGFEIDKDQFQNCVNNFKNLDKQNVLQKVAPCDKKVIIDLKDNLRKQNVEFKSFYNKVLLVRKSYQSLVKNSYFLEDQILLTNIPYGIQCKVNKQLYEQFDQFLEQNHKKFKKVFILNIDNNKDANYLIKSKYDWKLVLGFYNDGKKMGFFQFTNKKNTRIKPKDIVTITQMRGRRKKQLLKIKYDLSRIDQIKPNSKLIKDRVKLLKKKRRNLFLLRQKKYEDEKYEKIQSKVQIKDQKETKQLLKSFEKLVPKIEQKNIKKQLKKKGLLEE